MKNSILLFLTVFCGNFLFAQQVEIGEASYYNDKFHGSLTALGEKYDKNKYTCAHRTHNFGTMLKVTRLDNNKSVIVKVNDRGPFKETRVVDLSRAAAQEINLINSGVAQVKVEVLSSPDVSAINRRIVPKAIPQEREFTAKGAPSNVPSSYDKILSNEAVVKSASETVVAPKSVISPTTEKTAAKSPSPTATAEITPVKAVALMGIQERKGFGVQVSSYETFNDALKYVGELEKMWFKNIFIIVKQGEDGISRYGVVLGPFDKKLSAATYKTNLKSKYQIDGFLVDLGQ